MGSASGMPGLLLQAAAALGAQGTDACPLRVSLAHGNGVYSQRAPYSNELQWDFSGKLGQAFVAFYVLFYMEFWHKVLCRVSWF